MNVMKKLTVALCIILCTTLFLGVSVSATSGGITPRWSNTSVMTSNISSDDNFYFTSVDGKLGTETIAVSMVIEEKDFWGNYTTVSSYNGVQHSRFTYFSKSYSFVSGKTYRLTVYATVKLNGTYETIKQTVERKI